MEYMRGMAKYVSPSRLFQRSPKPSQEGVEPAVEGEWSDGRPVSTAVPAVVSFVLFCFVCLTTLGRASVGVRYHCGTVLDVGLQGYG